MQVQPNSFSLQAAYQKSRAGLASSMHRLATGDRLAEPGYATGDTISISQRLRGQVRRAQASQTALSNAKSFLDQADSNTDVVISLLQRAFELTQSSQDGLKTNQDRAIYDQELQMIKAEISDMTRQNTFLGKQTISTDVILSFDGNTEKMRFWQPTGENEQFIERDFSAIGIDAESKLLEFDSSEAYSMSRDGDSLYYLSQVTGDAAGTVRIHRYDIDSHLVYTGTDLFASGDTMYTDEDGALYVNGSGTLYTMEIGTLSRTATPLVNMAVGQEFTVYKGDAIYQRGTDDVFNSVDLGTLAVTNLTVATPFAVAGATNAISSSGGYAVDEVAPGSIRVIDMRTGNTATLAIGGASAVVDLQFSSDGDKIYFVNQESKTINSISVKTDENGQIIFGSEEKVIQGLNNNSFQGLDMGGSSYASKTEFALSQDSVSILSYESVDLSLYALGINNIHIDTLADAAIASTNLKEAVNRASAARAKIRAYASRFSFTERTHREFIANAQNIEGQIRNVDIARESTIFTTMQLRENIAGSILKEYNNLQMNVLRLVS